MRVLVYSDDASTREKVRLAIGRRPAADVPLVEMAGVRHRAGGHRSTSTRARSTSPMLDGEAQPAGGMGIARQAKDEIHECPPICVLIGRRDDRWLADVVARRGRRAAPDRPDRPGRGRRRPDAPPPRRLS